MNPHHYPNGIMLDASAVISRVGMRAVTSLRSLIIVFLQVNGSIAVIFVLRIIILRISDVKPIAHVFRRP
jgi:hypothetical protein